MRTLEQIAEEIRSAERLGKTVDEVHITYREFDDMRLRPDVQQWFGFDGSSARPTTFMGRKIVIEDEQ